MDDDEVLTLERRPPTGACGEPCPGSSRRCQRTDAHEEHRALLSSISYVFWTGGYPVKHYSLLPHDHGCDRSTSWSSAPCTCDRVKRSLEGDRWTGSSHAD